MVPAPLSEQRKPDPGEGARAGDAAAAANEFPRSNEVRRVGAVAGELEREVALDAGREIARGAVIHRPRPVGPLVVADVLRDSSPDLLVAGAEEMGEQQVLRVHGGVRFQLRPPVPVSRLLAGEPSLCAIDDQIQRGTAGKTLGCDHDTPLCSRRARSSSYAPACSPSRLATQAKPAPPLDAPACGLRPSQAKPAPPLDAPACGLRPSQAKPAPPLNHCTALV